MPVALDPDVRIQRVREVTTFDERGRPIKSIEVSFTVKEQGPFTLDIPQAEYSAETMSVRINELAKKVKELLQE